MTSASNEESVILELADPSAAEGSSTEEDISVSTADIRSWNLPSILCFRIVKVQADRTRLVQESSYFHGLLGGSFSESSLHHVSIQWNLEMVLNVLQFIYGCSLDITSDNFLLLLEGALFFGVEKLLLECETWFHQILSGKGLYTSRMPLDTLLEIHNFGLEHGLDFVAELCEGYLAKNFAWAISCSSFADIPYNLLHSCVEHPELTVESEKQLCEALFVWLSNNMKTSESLLDIHKSDCFDILKKVRIHLLPLGFAAGKRRDFLQFADEAICTVLDLMEGSSSIMQAITSDNSDNLRIRLTRHSKKIVLSGCPQMMAAVLFLAVLPYDLDATSKIRIIRSLIELDCHSRDNYQILEKSLNTLAFEDVCEVDLSKCPKVHSGAAITWFHLAFPSLRILKASHNLHFKMHDFYYLIQKCPFISEIDLTVDVSPVISTKMSVISSTAEGYPVSDGTRYRSREEQPFLCNVENVRMGKPVLSNIVKLTLEGRNDISDLDLLKISTFSDFLSYLNIKGCTLVTDIGISELLYKCLNIQSLVLSYTSFGRNSILTLCSSSSDFYGIQHDHGYSGTMASRLKELHIDGCKGVDQNSMLQLMHHTLTLNILSLKQTSLLDNALCEFMGTSLESLDVSETTVSVQALTHVIRRNPLIRYLKVTGCRNLHQHENKDLTHTTGPSLGDLFCELGKECILEEVAFGWGFSSFQLQMLEFSISKIRAITLGLGASLDQHAFFVLLKSCPFLESMIVSFQVLSDIVLRSILESLKHLQVLWLRCCLGDLSALGFQISMPNLRTLRLEWITPWMTNTDLVILTHNCSNLIELSLSGCRLLDADSQQIISSGWPGLTLIHLEDCGRVTSDGVTFLFNCKAVEDLLLRHNGRGIRRNFISDAASKLRLLRKVALDLCDACDGGFDSPSPAERCYLSSVRISRCKPQRCGFDLQAVEAFKPLHKETIVLEWNSKELRTTVVKERL